MANGRYKQGVTNKTPPSSGKQRRPWRRDEGPLCRYIRINNERCRNPAPERGELCHHHEKRRQQVSQVDVSSLLDSDTGFYSDTDPNSVSSGLLDEIYDTAYEDDIEKVCANPNSCSTST